MCLVVYVFVARKVCPSFFIHKLLHTVFFIHEFTEFVSLTHSLRSCVCSMSVPEWKESSDGAIHVMKPSPFNDHILLGSRQFIKSVRLEPSGGTQVIRSMKSVTATTALAFHPSADCVFAAASSNGEVGIWFYGASNISALNEKWTAHSRTIHAIEFIPANTAADSAGLITAGADGDLNIWEIGRYTGKRETWKKVVFVANPRSERSGLRDLDVRVVDGGFIEVLTASEDGSVEFYNSVDPHAKSLRQIFKLQVSTQTINSVRFYGNMFATGGKDSYIRVFDLPNHQQTSCSQLCFIRCLSPVWAVRWRPATNHVLHIASCQSVMDSAIYIWDLSSRLMPAYVFDSHGDSVTDFFWIDSHHLLSCSRDSSIQMHAIKNAIIPIEKMRTVNISFAPGPVINKACLTSICSQVNRGAFEKTHPPIDFPLVCKNGYTQTSSFINSPILPHKSSQDKTRTITKRLVSVDATTFTTVGSLIEFISEISQASTRADVSKICGNFAPKIGGLRGNTISMLSWLLQQPGGTSNSVIIPAVLEKGLQVYRSQNDVTMALALGCICLYATHPEYLALVKHEDYVVWSNSMLTLLRKRQYWQLAAEFVFHSPLPEIRSLSHSRTGLNIACKTCTREIPQYTTTCSKCTGNPKINTCVLCGSTVKGLFIACTQCNMGGHYKHLQEWFTKFQKCPNCLAPQPYSRH